MARLGSIYCAILLAKLVACENEIRARDQVAALFGKLLNDCVGVQNGGDDHAKESFTVVLQDAFHSDHVRRVLRDAGVATGVYHAKPSHRHEFFEIRCCRDKS